MSTQLKLLPPTLVSGFCFVNWQQILNDFFSGAYALFPDDLTTWNYGPTSPSADKRNRPWYRTNVDGTPDRVYGWSAVHGKWVSPHPVPPNPLPTSPGKLELWNDTLANLLIYDSGVNEAISETTGPFWQEEPDMQGRTAVGPGTLNPSGTVVAQGDTGGVDEVTLSSGQGATLDHSHGFGNVTDPANDDVFLMLSGNVTIPSTQMMFVPGSGTTRVVSNFTQANLITGKPLVNGAAVEELDPVNLMNPYRGVYYIKRTARKYYTAT